MLHASGTWPLTNTNLQGNDRAMIRQICSIKPEDVATLRSSQLLAKLELEDLNLILRERRLCWFRQVEHSGGAVRTACDIQIDGRQGAGRPKLIWKKLTDKDCHEWKTHNIIEHLILKSDGDVEHKLIKYLLMWLHADSDNNCNFLKKRNLNSD